MAGRKIRGGSVLYSYKEERRYAGRGIAALVLALLSLGLLVLLTCLGKMLAENAGIWLGALGIGAFVLAIIGMLEGFMSFRDDCKSYGMSRAGTLFSALMVAVWFLIFCFGLAV